MHHLSLPKATTEDEKHRFNIPLHNNLIIDDTTKKVITETRAFNQLGILEYARNSIAQSIAQTAVLVP